MGQVKKILFITGTRADFGKLKPLMLTVERSSQFECQIFATGMHVLLRHGMTFDEIRKTGFKNIFLFMNQTESSSPDMDMIVANTIHGLANYVRVYRPALIVVHGDRPEALAGAIVGVLNNILVAHIEGGELSGTVDEIIRHSVSKLSHIHCVANQKARKRLIQLGEDSDSIHVIGSPEVDIMTSRKLPSLKAVKERYAIPFEKYGIFCYHPVTTELARLPDNIRPVVSALIRSGRNFVVIEPNNDKGSEIIYNALESLRGHPNFRVFCSMRFEYYIRLLKHAEFIAGNSSSGIREASVFGIPCINIGTRQDGRVDDHSVINIMENQEDLSNALRRRFVRGPVKFPFGRGNSAKEFMTMLSLPCFWETSLQKKFNDIHF